MNNSQPLGGTRQSSPLDDEMSYPLTEDEYLAIKDNLATDRFSDLESFLLTTGITSFISGLIFWVTGSFEKKIIQEGTEKIAVNMGQIWIVIIYAAVSIGSIIGFLVSIRTKRKSKKRLHRLDDKIMRHLNKINS